MKIADLTACEPLCVLAASVAFEENGEHKDLFMSIIILVTLIPLYCNFSLVSELILLKYGYKKVPSCQRQELILPGFLQVYNAGSHLVSCDYRALRGTQPDNAFSACLFLPSFLPNCEAQRSLGEMT